MDVLDRRAPRRKASSSDVVAVGGRALERAQQLVEVGAVEAGTLSSSRERIALANACWKVRPIAIASPTDFMCVVELGSAPGNFSNANRGHLTTT